MTCQLATLKDAWFLTTMGQTGPRCRDPAHRVPLARPSLRTSANAGAISSPDAEENNLYAGRTCVMCHIHPNISGSSMYRWSQRTPFFPSGMPYMYQTIETALTNTLQRITNNNQNVNLV